MDRRDNTSSWLILLLIAAVWINFAQWYRAKYLIKKDKTDTVEVVRWDTIHDSVPDIRYETLTRYVRVPDSIFLTDTVTKERVLPIVQRKYTDDSTYTAYVSGLRYDIYPRLDSISVRQKMIERTIIRQERQRGMRVKIRPAFAGGYDIVHRQWGIMAGGAVILDW